MAENHQYISFSTEICNIIAFNVELSTVSGSEKREMYIVNEKKIILKQIKSIKEAKLLHYMISKLVY